jgi:hypothetical protein
MCQKLDQFPCSYKKDGETPAGPSSFFFNIRTRTDPVFEMLLLVYAFWRAKQ